MKEFQVAKGGTKGKKRTKVIFRELDADSLQWII